MLNLQKNPRLFFSDNNAGPIWYKNANARNFGVTTIAFTKKIEIAGTKKLAFYTQCYILNFEKTKDNLLWYSSKIWALFNQKHGFEMPFFEKSYSFDFRILRKKAKKNIHDFSFRANVNIFVETCRAFWRQRMK